MRLLKGILITLGGLTLFAALLAAAVFPFLGRLMESGDAPKEADAIVLLGGNPVRAIYGAELYKKGFAPTLYVSRVEFIPHQDLPALGLRFTREEEYVQQALALKGVPREAVHLYGNGVVSTVEEAEALRGALPSPPRTLLLVTGPFHCRRAKLVFSRVFPESEILACPDPREALAERWWKDRRSALLVLLETAKTAHYLLGGAFRSSDPPGRPGR
ncbi:ElyC/SanA/YdcF family protein [Desulfovibrio aminophilus]|uniref:YdcF family protein n=1 Tax=Desulfovibrio aminophilus TaxID=81425 RepID=UPI003396BABE